MPTDPITVRVVCGYCEGTGTNVWDGLVCARCDGDKTLRMTLDPSSLEAAKLELAEAVMAQKDAYERWLADRCKDPAPQDKRLAMEAALAAVRAHPDYEGGA
jgi:hypothetical protein